MRRESLGEGGQWPWRSTTENEPRNHNISTTTTTPAPTSTVTNWGFLGAPEWTRTATEKILHKALNRVSAGPMC